MTANRISELVIPRGVTRYDYGRTLGWLVRVYRTEGDQQKCARRLFSDGVHGGELGALDAATAWQSEQRESWPPRGKKRAPGYGYVQRTTRRYRTSTGESRTYEAYEAWFWDADERPCSTSWSIDTHGEDAALARCNAWLERCRTELLEGQAEPLQRVG